MGDGFVMVTVPGEPLVSREEIEEIRRRANDRPKLRTPEEIEKNRQELLDILLNCPVMTDEELQGFEEARKEINECRLAFWGKNSPEGTVRQHRLSLRNFKLVFCVSFCYK